jgi:hypothetical protein
MMMNPHDYVLPNGGDAKQDQSIPIVIIRTFALSVPAGVVLSEGSSNLSCSSRGTGRPIDEESERTIIKAFGRDPPPRRFRGAGKAPYPKAIAQKFELCDRPDGGQLREWGRQVHAEPICAAARAEARAVIADFGHVPDYEPLPLTRCEGPAAGPSAAEDTAPPQSDDPFDRFPHV